MIYTSAENSPVFQFLDLGKSEKIPLHIQLKIKQDQNITRNYVKIIIINLITKPSNHYTLCKICQNTDFLCFIYSRIRVESTTPSL